MRGYYDDKEDILARLKRIEGQIRGLQRMVDNDEYCIDILTQITAASNALKKVAVGLLDDHIRHCVLQGTEDGKDMVREATAAIERLVKSWGSAGRLEEGPLAHRVLGAVSVSP